MSRRLQGDALPANERPKRHPGPTAEDTQLVKKGRLENPACCVAPNKLKHESPFLALVAHITELPIDMRREIFTQLARSLEVVYTVDFVMHPLRVASEHNFTQAFSVAFSNRDEADKFLERIASAEIIGDVVELAAPNHVKERRVYATADEAFIGCKNDNNPYIASFHNRFTQLDMPVIGSEGFDKLVKDQKSHGFRRFLEEVENREAERLNGNFKPRYVIRRDFNGVLRYTCKD